MRSLLSIPNMKNSMPNPGMFPIRDKPLPMEYHVILKKLKAKTTTASNLIGKTPLYIDFSKSM